MTDNYDDDSDHNDRDRHGCHGHQTSHGHYARTPQMLLILLLLLLLLLLILLLLILLLLLLLLALLIVVLLPSSYYCYYYEEYPLKSVRNAPLQAPTVVHVDVALDGVVPGFAEAVCPTTDVVGLLPLPEAREKAAGPELRPIVCSEDEGRRRVFHRGHSTRETPRDASGTPQGLSTWHTGACSE